MTQSEPHHANQACWAGLYVCVCNRLCECVCREKKKEWQKKKCVLLAKEKASTHFYTNPQALKRMSVLCELVKLLK